MREFGSIFCLLLTFNQKVEYICPLNDQRMGQKDYISSFTVKATPLEVYDAITRVTEWWTGNTEGKSTAAGDVFTVTFGDIHRTTQRIAEAKPGKRVVWHVTKCYLNFVKNNAEWEGTDIVFEIEPAKAGTRMTMTHVGLAGLECKDGCSKGWDFYIGSSLRKFISTGKGQPDASKSKTSTQK